MTENEKIILNKKANIFKALAHPTRLWIVEKLTTSELCVCEFVKHLEVDFSTISKHLAILKQAGLVIDEKRGKQVFYRLKVPCVLKFLDCVQGFVKNNAIEQSELLY